LRLVSTEPPLTTGLEQLHGLTGRPGGTGWLPEPLRPRVAAASGSPDAGDTEALPAFLADDNDGEPRAVAAE
jgi:hypothetical protein